MAQSLLALRRHFVFSLIGLLLGLSIAQSQTDLLQQSSTWVQTTIAQLFPAESQVVRAYFIGNSGTDELGADNSGMFPRIVRSAGHQLELKRSSIPGAPIDWLWEHRTEANGEADILQGMAQFAPVDHLTLMPIYRSTEEDVDYGGRFYQAALRHSSDVQLWLYAVWANTESGTNDAWQTETLKLLAQVEATRAGLDAANGGNSVGIIPGGMGFTVLKQAIEAGQIPGIDDFRQTHFKDGVHLTESGIYFVSLLYYAAFFEESPEGKVTDYGPLTAAQARAYQKIAWEVIRNYPWA